MEKQITITINEETLKGLNNAVAVYGDLCFGILLGTSVPSKFEKLTTLSDEELKSRFNAVKNLCLELEKKFRE